MIGGEVSAFVGSCGNRRLLVANMVNNFDCRVVLELPVAKIPTHVHVILHLVAFGGAVTSDEAPSCPNRSGTPENWTRDLIWRDRIESPMTRGLGTLTDTHKTLKISSLYLAGCNTA